jgi:hypothetical protein
MIVTCSSRLAINVTILTRCWVFEGDGIGREARRAAGGALGVRTSESEELEPEMASFFRLSLVEADLQKQN